MPSLPPRTNFSVENYARTLRQRGYTADAIVRSIAIHFTPAWPLRERIALARRIIFKGRRG